MTRLFLFCILFFCFFNAWTADFHRTINWLSVGERSDNLSKSFPVFENSITIDRTRLPYWFESFEIDSPNVEVLLSNAVFEPVPYFDGDSASVPDGELRYTSEVVASAGKNFLRLTVFPFVRRNNQIEKLVDFTISVNEKGDQLKSAAAGFNWKSSSVLATGKWVKIKTKNKGIYKISYDQLTSWGFNSPDQVSVYGNGGFLLPMSNSDLKYDDLSAYPIWKGKDNNSKDCIFFYSSGNLELKKDEDTGVITHQQNYYATETYFYLTDQGIQKLITKSASISDAAGRQVTSFLNYAFSEKELINLIHSGSQWFGEHFIQGSQQTVEISLDNPEMEKPASFQVSVAGRSSASSTMDVLLNGKSVNKISFANVDVSDPTTLYADNRIVEFKATLSSKNPQIKLIYNSSNSTSEAWLDFISINYQSFLSMNSDVYSFRGKGVDGSIPVSEFVVSGATASTHIFDVTDYSNATEVTSQFSDGQMKFKSNTSTIHEYVAFNPAGSIPVPELVGNVANQNLHASDLSEFIIVTNPALASAANDIANFHRTTDQMTVQVLTPELIYNEFSGGLPDPAGLRNYFRMCYDKGKQSGKKTLKYILLMGDGSYDNRNLLGKNRNLLPTFQSANSLEPTRSFVTDDFFAFLDENEGGSSFEGGINGAVDLGIGRIPAEKLSEAEDVFNKIKDYKRQETMGNWRNVVTFIADDEDGNLHMNQSELLANLVNTSNPAFLTNKIYLDAYPQISSSAGEKYPDVTTAINSSVKQGALVMNYTGHANEKNLAAENVLDIGNIDAWTNINNLPIFVTATCEFSRYDADEMSAGEHILFNPIGGGIGLFSTTRVVFSTDNSTLNRKFFKYIFEKDEQGNNLRLGDVIRLTKATTNTGTNQLNFSLLADPAIRLLNPTNNVVTSSINESKVGDQMDTIRPLTVVKIKGFVADNKGVKLSSFNGEIIPTVYDKAMRVETLGNAGQKPMEYKLQNNIVYRGLASVKDGEFEFSFFVPKDISYKLDKGKILYYAYNETIDAQGYFDGFYIGGSSNSAVTDNKGPEIKLFMNSDSFKEGGTVSVSSVLLANITDESGINTVGTGIGHDITAVLDGDNSNIMVLNDYFQSDKDSYSSGSIVFPLTKLSEGEHVLKLKVWDVFNNSSEKEIRFVVKDNFRIETVSCYPNPVQEETQFIFTTNLPDETFDVDLEIFETSGSRVDILPVKVGSAGTESLPITWNPAERKVRMRSGVYIYRMLVTANGKQSSGSGRLVYIQR
jgi:hypothetical protein